MPSNYDGNPFIMYYHHTSNYYINVQKSLKCFRSYFGRIDDFIKSLWIWLALRSFKNIAFWSSINTMHKQDVQLQIVHVGRNLIHELIKMRPRTHVVHQNAFLPQFMENFPATTFFAKSGSRGIWHIKLNKSRLLDKWMQPRVCYLWSWIT